MARNQLTPKTVAQYGLFAVIVIILYRIYSGGDNGDMGDTPDSFNEETGHHPRNVHIPQNDRTMDELDKAWGGVQEGGGGHGAEGDGQMEEEGRMKRVNLNELPRDPVDDLVEEAGESGRNDGSRKREIDLGEMPRHDPKDHADLDDIMIRNARHKFVQDNIMDDKFHDDGIDIELEREMGKRMEMFMAQLEGRREVVGDDEFKNFVEDETEYLPFATAGSHTTFPATLEFIYSIQYFYPKSEIAVYDLGLLQEEKDYMNSLCNVQVETLWLELWPENMYKNRHRTWRPVLLQFAMGKFDHFVYVEPGRYINKQRLRDYLKHSRRNGVTIVGNQLKYTTFSVTHPNMYKFLQVDETKVKKAPHFNFNIIIIHNNKRVRHYFMRHLLSCIMEEYCIAPPGAKSGCDANLERTHKWANCHRFDESAINLILGKWHNYKTDEYLTKDAITKHYDGKDVSKKLKVCAPPVDRREDM